MEKFLTQILRDKLTVLHALCILENCVGGSAGSIVTRHHWQHRPVHLGPDHVIMLNVKRILRERLLVVADKEEDGILADGLKGGGSASSVSEQVVHPVGREELSGPGRETQPGTKTVI